MKKAPFILLLNFLYLAGCAQTESRIKIAAITFSENTGEDYSSWLADDVSKLVPKTWNAANFKYIDITLRLENKSNISRLSLYDQEGSFADNPATLYALNGNQKTLIGTFTGEQYNVFVNMYPPQPMVAEAIVVHKYCNNIPQKIFIYGTSNDGGNPVIPPVEVLVPAIISFNNLTDKTVGDAAFKLSASSTNSQVPVTFSSSNTSVVNVYNSAEGWMATPLTAGTANITASQAGNNGYLPAIDLVRTQVVKAAPIVPNGKAIPGKIEAENYNAMSGIQTEPANDAGSTLNVGWVDDNDWMDYDVNVATTGSYTLNMRVASIYDYGKINLRAANGTVLATIATPNTGGWQNWTTVSTTVLLNAGAQTLRIFADRGGWNLNWFEAVMVTSTPVTPSPPGPVTGGLIPIDGKRWYQLTNASSGLEGLFDKKTDVDVKTGFGKIFEQYDSYYPVINGEQMDISGLKFYDGGGTNENYPMVFYAITADGTKTRIATFTGSQYNTWVGPDANRPGQFNLSATIKNVKYLMINSFNSFPTEIELYGNYTPGSSVGPLVKRQTVLNHMFGINGFEWNFEDPSRPYQIDEPNFKAVRNFPSIRHYMDWEKLEQSPGSYTFNPTQSGGWNYDAIYDSCKARGIEVLACLKTIPWWMQNTYPGDQRDYENVPAQFGKDLLNPNSYIEQAKVAFQYAARYGYNKNINNGMLSVSYSNTIKVGLGLIKYIECDNERDKWWKGRKAYQTAYEYAANLSAFYDGNKNTMGPGVGIKNADPSMQVVMAGLALPSTDYVKGMIDWCRQHRGFKADGSVDVCWDVINYHYYSNDSYASQNGNATRGTAPELSGAAETAADFLKVAHEYVNDMPVWVTELGYDINQGSIFKAGPVGNKTALQTQADWILRSSLLYARAGIDRIFFYTMYDDNLYNGAQFSSSGLLNADRSRKPAADYLYQANKLLGQYTYRQTIDTDPIVDRYELDGNQAYAVMIGDEKGRTAQYTLDLGNAAQAKIYTPKPGSDVMDLQTVATINGKLTITATETPVFILPVSQNVAAKKGTPAIVSKDVVPLAASTTLENAIRLFPNPVSDVINFNISNKDLSNVSIKIFEEGSGRIFKNIQFSKTAKGITKAIDISNLPGGNYIIEISQGGNKTMRKMLKTFR